MASVASLERQRPESAEVRLDVRLDYIVNHFFSWLNECEQLLAAKQEAEEEFDIIYEDDGCWSDDDIKRVLEETKGMANNSLKKKYLALVIFQLIERHKNVQNSEYSDEYSGREHTPSDQFWPIHGVRQSSAGAEYLVFDGNTVDIPGVPRGHYWKPVESRSPQSTADLGSVGAGGDKQSIICIRIPLAEMVDNEQTPRADEEHRVPSPYTLIDGFPSRTDLRKRKSYAMSFNNETKNAKWVYEILNEETLANNPVKQIRFKPPYNRGHLASAANHRWCQEAVSDANLNSNITPQNKSLNSGNWNTIENKCRKLTEEQGIRNVHVYSGPLYLRDKQMDLPVLEGKKVPSDFFKVIIVENVDGTVREPECYLMPNEKITPNCPITDTDRLYGDLPRTVFGLIQYIERESELTFIERRPNVREDRIISVTLQGEGPNGKKHEAKIQARICPNN